MSKVKKKKVCPECGIDLTGLDPKAHALDHWPEDIMDVPGYEEARKRQKILLEMAEE